MTDPYQYVTSTGTIIPDTSNILLGVQDEYKAVFGADLVVTSDTPQGVLITAEALARAQEVNNNAALANQINPNIAGGVFLDAIMAMTLPSGRTPATKTLVSNVTLTGVASTVISAGSQAKTTAGDIFESLDTITLDDSGNGIVDFSALEYGAVACDADELNTIVSNVLGWETVDNSTAGVLGTTTQSDQAARALRSNTLGFQGVALPVAITSALYATAEVTSLSFRENIEATTQVIDGVTMVAHSIYVCVDGGSETDIAAALLENKSSGAAWNGGTSVDVVEPASGQTYTVKFDRPDIKGILVRVTTSNGNVDNIKSAIVAYAAGTVGGLSGFVVGNDVSPFEIAGAITYLYPDYFISKVEISHTSPVSYTTDTIAIGIDEIAYTQSSYLTVVVP